MARHRDQDSIALNIQFPINWQLDADLCGVIQGDLDRIGPWESYKATPTLTNHIPAVSGLYMFVFRSHFKLSLAAETAHTPLWVMYVGRAGDGSSKQTLRDRYRNDYAKHVGGDPEQLWDDAPKLNRAAALKKYLSLWPLEYWFLPVEDRTAIPDLEKRLIRLFAPPLNKIGRLRVRTREMPAFKVPQ
ncbi:hypothetical protein [Caulobacter sp. RHG1]|uniref:hypothetical protein n=1 Tax=Caulobacter sp. (strain RHG1) TaxID=2545762 RepID=UPI0015573A87|nr:hypothetical protein [Caulobacter sp. RHG1]